MAATTLLTFAELDFVLRCAEKSGATAAQVGAVRERLSLRLDEPSEPVTAAGIASLVARELCTLHGDDVVPGALVTAAVAALSTVHTMAEAAGWIDERPVVAHMFTGAVARLVLYPGSYRLFGAEAIDASEPLARPLERFVELCTAEPGETAVIIRCAPVTGGAETGLAVARDADGRWRLSDTATNPDQSRPVSRAEVTEQLEALFGAAVGA
jgi:hypothetical protein